MDIKKQKINTRSCTESELVGVDDITPLMLWTRYLIEAPGYKVDETTFNQVHLSAMLLETKGHGSSSNRTKQIDVQCFFIKEIIGSGEITMKHFPTEEMLRDNFTKEVQGSQFKKFRTEIQGIEEIRPDAKMGWYQSCLKPTGPRPQ
jgi:hypothetical protein